MERFCPPLAGPEVDSSRGYPVVPEFGNVYTLDYEDSFGLSPSALLFLCLRRGHARRYCEAFKGADKGRCDLTADSKRGPCEACNVQRHYLFETTGCK